MGEQGRSSEVDAYIADFPAEVQKILEDLRGLVWELAPDAKEAKSYGIPTFKIDGKNLIHFAGYKRHIGFYPTPAVIAEFQDDLAGYKQAKGSVQFPLDKPIPYELVRRMVTYRITEFRATGK